RQHRDVPVGVASGQQGPPADPTPDPYRLLGTVVQDIRLGLADDPSPTLVRLVRERDAAADHPLAGDAVQLLADRPHEVTPTTRGDVVADPACVQVVQQLDHWCVATG